MSEPAVPGRLREGVVYFNNFGRLAITHEFAEDYAETGRMTFVLRFSNDGDKMPLLAINNSMYKSLFKFFVDGSTVAPEEDFPKELWLSHFGIQPAHFHEIEVDAFLNHGYVVFPGSTLFEVGTGVFEVECAYSKVVSNCLKINPLL